MAAVVLITSSSQSPSDLDSETKGWGSQIRLAPQIQGCHMHSDSGWGWGTSWLSELKRSCLRKLYFLRRGGLPGDAAKKAMLPHFPQPGPEKPGEALGLPWPQMSLTHHAQYFFEPST